MLHIFAVLLMMFWCLLGPICCVAFLLSVVLRDHACPNIAPGDLLCPCTPNFSSPCAIPPLYVLSNPCVVICALFVLTHMVMTMFVFVCVFVCVLLVLYVCACLCLGLLVHVCWCFVLFSVSATTLCAWVCVCTCISCLCVCVRMCVFCQKYVYFDNIDILINYPSIIFTYLLINISYLGPNRLV